MSIIRLAKHTDKYVVLDKTFLEDQNISLRLKGFLAYCLSKPDDWQFHVNQLVEVLKEGKDALYSIIAEGEKFGYISSEQNKSPQGKFQTYDYLIHEVPFKIIKPQRAFPDAESPVAENPQLLSNDNTKELPDSSISSSSNLHRLQPNRGELFENAAAASEGNQETIWYTNCQAGKSSITRSDIFQHFLKLNYPVEIIKASIDKFAKSTDPVRSPLKLLESIAERLAAVESSAKSYEAPPKPASSVYEPLTNPKKLDPKFFTKKAKDHAKSIF